MIHHISIKNFAIIKNTEIDFQDGLNIITGETGAGKSIVIEAVSLALGSRADSSYVRTGTDKAVIQLAGSLNDEEIVITREISATGKNLCRLNGELVTLAQLNQTARQLADIHGQYDNQSLLNPDSHITLIDSYRHDTIGVLKDAVSSSFADYARIRSSLIKLLNSEKENRRKMDFFRYEAAEIKAAHLRIGEDQELESQISIMQNGEKIYDNMEKAYSVLYGSSPSAMDGLRSALSAIDEISTFSPELNQLCQGFGDVLYGLEDLCDSLLHIKDSISFNPTELDRLIARMDQIDGLKKKYGDSIEDILAYHDKISRELSLIENFDEEKASLEKQLKAAFLQLRSDCSRLTEARTLSAAMLEQQIQKELIDLNFVDAQIKINITPLEKPEETGMDKVEILITTNKGEPLKPLWKVASGGEMSRIMLAFKNIISSYDGIPTLIFDEIDTGISGVTASIVGRKLKEIAKAHQIICITHLPQIAACGNANFRIYKESDQVSTFTYVEPLTQGEKIKEIARLLGGDVVTETTLQSAQELIDRQHN